MDQANEGEWSRMLHTRLANEGERSRPNILFAIRLFTHEDTAKVKKKTECRPLKTSRTWGKMHIPIPKSHFYHRPSAHARNYGKMPGSHPNFEKLTIDFMQRRHYKCAFYTVICGIFITSLLSDLSLRVVTYDRTVVFAGSQDPKFTMTLKKFIAQLCKLPLRGLPWAYVLISRSMDGPKRSRIWIHCGRIHTAGNFVMEPSSRDWLPSSWWTPTWNTFTNWGLSQDIHKNGVVNMGKTS